MKEVPNHLNILTELAGEGKSKEEIYQHLLAKGWKVDAIEEGFHRIKVTRGKGDIQKRTTYIVLCFGALLFGAGIFSFIAANWEEMAKGTKVGIITFSMVIIYIVAWLLDEKWHYKRTGQALFLLGSIFYGAGIFLVAQIFNIRANWPDGFMLWMIGALAMAFALDAFNLFYLALAVGLVAIVGQPWIIGGAEFGHDPFLLTSSLLLLTTTAATFLGAFAIRKRIPQA